MTSGAGVRAAGRAGPASAWFPWLPARASPGGTPSSASSPVPLTRMIWPSRRIQATPAARNLRVSRMLPVNGAPGAGEQGWRGRRGGRTQVRGQQAPGRQSLAARTGTPGSQTPGSRVTGSRMGAGAPRSPDSAPHQAHPPLRVTFAWLIRASWSIRGPPAPSIYRQAWINHDNRRTSPPGVTPVACCGLL
jgi:hypothetical protein